MYSSITAPSTSSNQHQTAFLKKANSSAGIVLAPKADFKDSSSSLFLPKQASSIFSSNGNISSKPTFDTIDHNKNQFTYGAYNSNNKFNTTSTTNIYAANAKM